jgi:nucleotide-binding universal stress UspA family protein
LTIPVELLALVDPVPRADLAEVWQGLQVDELVAREMSGSTEYLEKSARSFAGVQIKCSVLKGTPEEVIIETAAADKNTLIALATHGRSGIRRWVLGSVTERVVRHSGDPVLIVRAA